MRTNKGGRDMMKSIVALNNFENAPKNGKIWKGIKLTPEH
jgi:hypothetical protein